MMLTLEASAQTRGFIETFQSASVASNWLFQTDGVDYIPMFDDSGAYHFIWGEFITNAGWLSADNSSSEGKLIGDYISTRIDAIEATVYVDFPAEVQGIDIFLYSGYNSNTYFLEYLAPPDTNWYRLNAPLDTNDWWTLPEGVYTSIPTQALTQVQAVGIVAYPVTGLLLATYINMADLALVPERIPPSLLIDMLGGAQQNEPQISLTAEQGRYYIVEWREDLMTQSWQILSNYSDIIGSNATVTVSDTNKRSQVFYRVKTGVHLSN